MAQETINVNIDGINVNATHFAKMTKKAGVEAILFDNITDDKSVAEKMWAESRKKVAELTKVSEEDQEKVAIKGEQAQLDAINRARAASGVKDEVVTNPTTLSTRPEDSIVPPPPPAKEAGNTHDKQSGK